MAPTMSEVLALDAVTQARPEVVAGTRSLDRLVRWAHVSELPDIAGQLRGGEVILSNGLVLPDGDQELRAYVADLYSVGAAGLLIELGRRFQGSLPPALLEAAEDCGLPIVALHQETRFVSITEAVHSLVSDSQLSELRISEELHQAFTEMSVEGADVSEVIRQAASLSGYPVVLENLAHQVLAYDTAGQEVGHVLAGWELRSRALKIEHRTTFNRHTGWLLTVVGARGDDWGRLVLMCDGSPRAQDRMLIERCASTLALNRLVERDRETLDRQIHRGLLTGIIAHSWLDAEVLVRARAIGVPLDSRLLVTVLVRRRTIENEPLLAAEQGLRDLVEITAAAAREVHLDALVGAVDDASIGVLLSVPKGREREDVVDGFAASLRRLSGDPGPVVAIGSPVGSIHDVRRSFLEAADVAAAALDQPARDIYRLDDIRLRGLLHLLRDDSRVQSYVERELGPLLDYDAAHDTALLQVLRTYLDRGRNKSEAAEALSLSRPALYDRLRRIQRLVNADLDDAVATLSLHVALLARDANRRLAPIFTQRIRP